MPSLPTPTTPTVPSTGIGTYKGTTITPGTQAQIQAQMEAIDAKNAGGATGATGTIAYIQLN